MAEVAEKEEQKAKPQQDAESEFESSIDDPGYVSHSRSQSRRRRRQNQRQRQSIQRQQNGPQAQGQAQSGDVKAQSQAQAMAPINEEQENTMQPFEWIGPDSTSMDGPVTYARAMRGEIPMRPGNPNQALKTAGGKQSKSLDDEEGLKLKLELNIDVEIELKAKIYGDLTLALLA